LQPARRLRQFRVVCVTGNPVAVGLAASRGSRSPGVELVKLKAAKPRKIAA
jgi:hypothetical protein